MIPRRWLLLLVAAAIAFATAGALLGGLAAILSEAGDATAGRVVGYVTVAVVLLLAVDLIVLVLALGWEAGCRHDDPSPRSPSEP